MLDQSESEALEDANFTSKLKYIKIYKEDRRKKKKNMGNGEYAALCPFPAMFLMPFYLRVLNI